MYKSEIHWNQAEIISARTREEKESRFEYLIDEIKTSNFDCLDGNDIDYYAAELTYNDLSGKKWSNNDVIDLNLEENPDKTKFDYLNCFSDSDNDSIIDYY